MSEYVYILHNGFEYEWVEVKRDNETIATITLMKDNQINIIRHRYDIYDSFPIKEECLRLFPDQKRLVKGTIKGSSICRAILKLIREGGD